MLLVASCISVLTSAGLAAFVPPAYVSTTTSGEEDDAVFPVRCAAVAGVFPAARVAGLTNPKFSTKAAGFEIPCNAPAAPASCPDIDPNTAPAAPCNAPSILPDCMPPAIPPTSATVGKGALANA